MAYISDKQIFTMDLISRLVDKFGEDRWFTKYELPGITQHTMDALVRKQYLQYDNVLGIVYYRRLKELKED